ncbi:uncharacterized protein LDX57_005966 [Aspergillus melleus]|uniref:uncharacterized protein n=1 Tax=Aspergillus melleus TaxID=138277 RepID=UPI001E8E524F|nr:uncharacterized protein LDX57_005966 [Aspergillus melleus]KAH8428263.1 hypothetical protein LDX57_005966 [Aspergillus melleus]
MYSTRSRSDATPSTRRDDILHISTPQSISSKTKKIQNRFMQIKETKQTDIEGDIPFSSQTAQTPPARNQPDLSIKPTKQSLSKRNSQGFDNRLFDQTKQADNKQFIASESPSTPDAPASRCSNPDRASAPNAPPPSITVYRPP